MLFKFSSGDAVSKELSLHPVHLVPDNEGELPPSALVPFCSYQSDNDVLGQRNIGLNNLTVCDKFEPTIHEGHLCYSLDIGKSVKRSSKAGKINGLRVLLDPNPFRLNVTTEKKADGQRQEIKVYVHTLAQCTAFGPGEYAMTALKRMKGTKSFKQLPDSQKNCQVHNREECETKRFLEEVRSNCNCIPRAAMTTESDQVGVL